MVGRALGVLLLLLVCTPAARAADVQIAPVRVELTSASPRANVVIRNGADASIRLELAVFSWAQSPEGEQVLTPTSNLVVYPPLVELGPKAERKFRVSASGGFGAMEGAYRLVVTELPGAPAKDATPGIKFVSRFEIPVYLAPRNPMQRVSVGDLAYASGQLRWQVRNVGNVRLAPGSLTVAGLDAQGASVFSKELDGWYVLAGAVRAFDYAVPKAGCAEVRKLTIELPAGKIPVRSGVETPGGACGP